MALKRSSVRFRLAPPCSPGKPTLFPGRRNPRNFGRLVRRSRGLRTEFRPFSRILHLNSPASLSPQNSVSRTTRWRQSQPAKFPGGVRHQGCDHFLRGANAGVMGAMRGLRSHWHASPRRRRKGGVRRDGLDLVAPRHGQGAHGCRRPPHRSFGSSSRRRADGDCGERPIRTGRPVDRSRA